MGTGRPGGTTAGVARPGGTGQPPGAGRPAGSGRRANSGRNQDRPPGPPAGPGAGPAGPPGPAGECRPLTLLARTCLAAMAEVYPGWRIWLDQHGWHARRRGGFLQAYHRGAPVFCVHADTAAGLAVQLCGQYAAGPVRNAQ